MATIREKYFRWKTPAITSIANMLNLTYVGSMELTQFPDEALIQAQKEMRRSKMNIKKKNEDTFIYFLKICHNICKAKALLRNPMFTKSLKLEFEITPEMNRVEVDNEALEELDPFDEENEEEFKKSQKGMDAIWSSSLNAQLSYRTYSGELPSRARWLDIKKTTIEQYEAGNCVIDNAFTNYLYTIFKGEKC